MNLKQIIASGATIIVVGTLAAGAPVTAEPLEGAGFDRPTCSSLQRFIVEATGDFQDRKAHAIVGLTGPDQGRFHPNSTSCQHHLLVGESDATAAPQPRR